MLFARKSFIFPVIGIGWILMIQGGMSQSADALKAPPAEPPGVHFVSREAKTTAEPGAQSVELSYEFTNTSDAPIAVQEFIQSCGCMSGEWDGKVIEPGGTGKIKARLLTSGLRGNIRKALKVKFLDLGIVELIGEVTIPEALVYSERTLHWNIGEPNSQKLIDVKVHSKKPVKILSVENQDPAFAVSLATVKEGHSYQILVVPRDTETERIGVFQVRTDAADPRDALQGIFAVIEKPKSEKGDQQ